METKKCISCKIDKPRNSEHFYYRNKTRGWLSSWCKECRKTKRNEHDAKSAENKAQQIRRGGIPCAICGAHSVAANKNGVCNKCARPKEFKLVQQVVRKACVFCGKRISDAKPNTKFCSHCKKNKRREEKRKDKCIYRSRLRKATPPWANKDDIRKFYAGVPAGMEVDHIVPIRGAGVCGLHVVYNLQYLTREENLMKSNIYCHDGGRK